MKTESTGKIFKIIITVVLLVWLFGASAYVAYDIWQNYKVANIERAFNAGREETINELIGQVEKGGCQPLVVYNNTTKKEIQIMDAKCAAASAETQE